MQKKHSPTRARICTYKHLTKHAPAHAHYICSHGGMVRMHVYRRHCCRVVLGLSVNVYERARACVAMYYCVPWGPNIMKHRYGTQLEASWLLAHAVDDNVSFKTDHSDRLRAHPLSIAPLQLTLFIPYKGQRPCGKAGLSKRCTRLKLQLTLSIPNEGRCPPKRFKRCTRHLNLTAKVCDDAGA